MHCRPNQCLLWISQVYWCKRHLFSHVETIFIWHHWSNEKQEICCFIAVSDDNNYLEWTFNLHPGPWGKGGGPVIPLYWLGEWQPVPLRLCGCLQRPCQRAKTRPLLWDLQARSPGFHWQQDAPTDGIWCQHCWEWLLGCFLCCPPAWER